jgi:hypothetical protein
MVRLTLAALLALLAPGAAAQGQPRETPEMLPPGAARDVTFHVCTPCHSTAVIRRSGFTAAQWDDLMDWMSERQNMAVLNPQLRSMIVGYLAENFPPRRTSPRGTRNPLSD